VWVAVVGGSSGAVCLTSWKAHEQLRIARKMKDAEQRQYQDNQQRAAEGIRDFGQALVRVAESMKDPSAEIARLASVRGDTIINGNVVIRPH